MGRMKQSIIGLAIALVSACVIKGLSGNLHNNTIGAGIFFAFFLIGMVVAWTSVMSNEMYVNEKKPQKVQKQKEPVRASVQKTNLNSLQTSSGFAVAGFVLGLLGVVPGIGLLFGVLAIIFGSIGLSQISKNPELKGKGIAIAGIVLGVLWIFITLIAAFGYILALEHGA